MLYPPVKVKNATRRRQVESSADDEEYFGRQQNEEDDGYQGVVQPNIKFASLKGKSPFYGDILDDDPIDCHDVCYAARTNGS
jgi:hypothetical protein